jgi:hypothetical protein
MAKQSEWPRGQADGSERGGPTGCFQTRDGVLKSNRSLAGPLRYGTAPGVGPKGDGGGNGASDFGMDRVEPRDFDPMGTPRNRFGEIPSELVSRSARRR